MPEEHNRVLTDHAADLCLAPTQVAMDHLANEGLADRAVLVGDVMTDICLRVRDAVAGHPPILPDGFTPGHYLVATVHRAENTDDRDRLNAIAAALAAIPAPVLLLAHPRLVARAADMGLTLAAGQVRVAAPMPYPDMVAAVTHSRGVVTDSGGLQKEAFLLGVPGTTLRTETEWPETLADGWNVLALDLDRVPDLAMRPRPAAARAAAYGDGHAAEQVVAVLASRTAQT
jgi:UDP-N-acetylglucosamine 2-epimerase (non-hydrolysing)